MKKIITIILCVLLAVGAVGGSFALAKHLDNTKVEQPNDRPTDSSQETPDENGSSDGGGGNTNVEIKPQLVKVWQLCTENTQFSVGDQIVIVAQAEEYALGTMQIGRASCRERVCQLVTGVQTCALPIYW